MATSKTLSTSAPETEQGTHVFRIVGYSQQTGLGKPIRSGKFSVGGHKWVAFLYPVVSKFPNGIDEHHQVAGVAMGPKSAKARASCKLRLINQRTGLAFSVHKAAPREFSHDNAPMEWTITVIKQPRIPEVKSFPNIEVPPSDIALHLPSCWKKRREWDITFSVGGKNIGAHKMVLAIRSPVFKAELYGPMREEGTEPIVVKDVQPDVFRVLLHFIYTDSLPPLEDLEEDDRNEIIRHLLVAAVRYAMERLKLMCQIILCENLSIQTVATTLALADQHHCDMLKDACIEFMACSSVMDAVEATQGYKNLKRTCPSVVVEALEKISRFRNG
ncbi:BTB/POZ and MATH domain-containing protein 2-like [Panicum hallii]|uniref:BTB/POZ and MATH domain-containing protein 2-like n=1 Tax=Panicum hallii TaxID=206008 RepID=UPI000DF4D7FB|nr:BTB/POZ and MATH domain-containing protein 2-like [Panicum hallii]